MILFKAGLVECELVAFQGVPANKTAKTRVNMAGVSSILPFRRPFFQKRLNSVLGVFGQVVHHDGVFGIV